MNQPIKIDVSEILKALRQGKTVEEAIEQVVERNLLKIDDEEVVDSKWRNFYLQPKWNPDPYNEMENGGELIKDIISCINKSEPEPNKQCECQLIPSINIEDQAEFENNCNMWLLQLKAFVLDTICEPEKANSQAFLDFLDELNRISVCF